MGKNTLSTNYLFEEYRYKDIHSAGPGLYFSNPCIGYIKKGYARFFYRGQTFYAYEGDLIYISYGTRYHSVWYGSPDIRWYSISFSFKSQYDYYEYPFQILHNYPSDLFDKMYETYENSNLMSVGYFYQILDDIYKKLRTEKKPVPFVTIQPAIEFIENNYNSKITINELAKLCHSSESGFFKLFKNSTGVTPVAYKHNLMIQNALELLSHTTLSIEEISTQVGFSSSNHFRTVFYKLTSKTPKDLRQKNEF